MKTHFKIFTIELKRFLLLIVLAFIVFLSFSGLALAGYDFDLVPEGTNLGWNWANPPSPHQIRNNVVKQEWHLESKYGFLDVSLDGEYNPSKKILEGKLVLKKYYHGPIDFVAHYHDDPSQ